MAKRSKPYGGPFTCKWEWIEVKHKKDEAGPWRILIGETLRRASEDPATAPEKKKWCDLVLNSPELLGQLEREYADAPLRAKQR